MCLRGIPWGIHTGLCHEPRELQCRADAFSRGEWLALLRDASQPLEASAGRARAPADADVERRAARAEALVHLGELSAASRSLTAGDEATLAELRDPSIPPGAGRRAQPGSASARPRRGLPCSSNTAAVLPARRTPRLRGGALWHDKRAPSFAHR